LPEGSRDDGDILVAIFDKTRKMEVPHCAIGDLGSQRIVGVVLGEHGLPKLPFDWTVNEEMPQCIDALGTEGTGGVFHRANCAEVGFMRDAS